MNIEHVLERVKKWAKNAGEIQLASFRKQNFSIKYKSINDLVSSIDLECETYIKNKIREFYPMHTIIAEESGNNDNGTEDQWYVDPLDGTTNYIQGLPKLSLSIALYQNKKPLIGVIISSRRVHRGHNK